MNLSIQDRYKNLRERVGGGGGAIVPAKQNTKGFLLPRERPVFADEDGDGTPDVFERQTAQPRDLSCVAPDGRSRRDNGNLMPFVHEERSYQLVFSASGALFAKLVTAGTLGTATNRKYLLRGSSAQQDKFDGKYIYAVGVDVEASAAISDVVDRDASIAARDFFINRLSLAGLKGSSENDTLFLSGVPVKHLVNLPLKLRADQINQVNQDGWSLRLDYPGVGRLDYASLVDLTVDAQTIAVTLRVKAWFANTKAEAARLAQAGVYDPLTQEFELMG
jgi:hypothetical protein